MRRFIVRKGWLNSASITILSAITTFIIAAAVTGIIGNFSGTVFEWLLKQLSTSYIWLLVVELATALVGTGVILYLERLNKIKDRAVTLANDIIESDDSLLRLLASLIHAKDHSAGMKRLLAHLLSDARDVFDGRINRASIFLPNATGEFLKIWAQYGMPQESAERTQFYVGGSKERMLGVAGETFLTKELRVVHLIQENDTWKADCEQYIKFSNTKYPLYRSFICLPILGPAPDKPDEKDVTCLGVVSFDSLDPRIFDDPSLQEVLRLFATRIAASLLIYQQILAASFPQSALSSQRFVDWFEERP